MADAIAEPQHTQGNDQPQTRQAIAAQQPKDSQEVQQGIQDAQENDQIGSHAKTLCRCAVCHDLPDLASNRTQDALQSTTTPASTQTIVFDTRRACSA